MTQGFWSTSNSEQKELTVVASFEILAPIMCEGQRFYWQIAGGLAIANVFLTFPR